ncbi:TetR/AcrR family transcriptional regulator [Nocardia cyriacigeorgica]|uniref:TetR/AcrR family transcriptional regulator n=1 Tax=Nocardia cyriacigeorgica TaxID=135487 RepID=UPI002453E6E4|nr:TetR/AcrR family transcriptional regulator [Nocardia cyriacigeorgica]
MTEELEQQPRRRGRPPKHAPAAPADDVFAAVLHAFAAHGYDGVSVRTLNQELGVSHNLLHARFGSKAAMWRAAVDWGFGNLVAALDTADDASLSPLARLRRFIVAFVMHSAEHPDLLRIVDIEAGRESDRLRYLIDTFIEPVQARMMPLFAHFATDAHAPRLPVHTAYFLITSGGGAPFTSRALTRTLFGDSALTSTAIQQHAEAIADVLTAGLSPSTDS